MTLSRSLIALPIAAACALAPLGRASAQRPPLTLMGGISLTAFDGDFIGNTGTTTSFLIGGYATFQFGPLAIEPGVVFTRKGAEISQIGAATENTIDYLQIPVLFKVSGPLTPSSRFYVGAGPALGFEIDCRFEGTNEALSTTVNCQEIDLDGSRLRTKSTEFSAIGEAGVEIGRYSLGVRADFGLTNIYDVITDDVKTESDLKTRTVSLVAGIRF